jgi:hypothetical protein
MTRWLLLVQRMLFGWVAFIETLTAIIVCPPERQVFCESLSSVP